MKKIFLTLILTFLFSGCSLSVDEYKKENNSNFSDGQINVSTMKIKIIDEENDIDKY